MKLLHFEWEVAGGAKRGEDVLDVVRNAVGDAVIRRQLVLSRRRRPSNRMDM